MLIVKIKKGENINSALKRFKRKFRDTRIVQEFVKPSEKKRKQKQKAIYRAKFLHNNDV